MKVSDSTAKSSDRVKRRGKVCVHKLSTWTPSLVQLRSAKAGRVSKWRTIEDYQDRLTFASIIARRVRLFSKSKSPR